MNSATGNLPLAGTKGLVTGIANDKSIAFAVAKAIRDQGLSPLARGNLDPGAAANLAGWAIKTSCRGDGQRELSGCLRTFHSPFRRRRPPRGVGFASG